MQAFVEHAGFSITRLPHDEEYYHIGDAELEAVFAGLAGLRFMRADASAEPTLASLPTIAQPQASSGAAKPRLVVRSL